MSNDLSFSSHIANIVKTAFQRSNLIFLGFSSKDPVMLTKAFVTYVRPLLEYNTVVWSPYLLGDIQKIEKVQRSFTKRLKGFRELSYKEILRYLTLETLELRRIRFDLIEVFKIFKGFSVLNFDDFFELKRDKRTRGHHLQLRLRYIPKNDAVRNFFANRVIEVWNSLPRTIIGSASVEVFKSSIDTDFLKPFCRYSM